MISFRLELLNSKFNLLKTFSIIKTQQCLIKAYLSWYLLQMTTLGKVARAIGSVEETRLVDTVEVVNCFTVLVSSVEFCNFCDFFWKPAAEVNCQYGHGKNRERPKDFPQG